MNTKKLGKIDVASRQLCSAIRMFFYGWDHVAAYSLACSSGEVFRHLCQHKNISPFINILIPRFQSKKKIISVLNKHWNFFKHADRDHNDIIDFDDDETELMLWVATYDAYRLLNENVPNEIRAYYHWFLNCSPEADGLGHKGVPGMRTATREAQLKFGIGLLIAGEKPELFAARDERTSDNSTE